MLMDFQTMDLAVLLLFANFLKNGFIFCTQLLGDDIDQLSRDGFHLICKVGKVRVSIFSHNS